jgi:hypothetical protein
VGLAKPVSQSGHVRFSKAMQAISHYVIGDPAGLTELVVFYRRAGVRMLAPACEGTNLGGLEGATWMTWAFMVN